MAKGFKTDIGQTFGGADALIKNMQDNTHDTHNTHSVYDAAEGQAEDKQKRINITIHPALHEKARRLAYERHMTFSGLLADILENEIIKAQKDGELK